MSDDIYPTNLVGLGFTVLKTARFSTVVQQSTSFVETRVVQSRNPIWRWTLLYDVLSNNPNRIAVGESYPDLQRLLGFYLKHQGMFDSFLFPDPDDGFVGPALVGGTPNPQAQLFVVQDAVTGISYSPIQRAMGGQFYEDITDLDGGITVFDNAIPTTDYVIIGPGVSITGAAWAGKVLQWNSAPTGPVTAQFNFFFRVRFETDEQDFEKFVNQLWCAGGSEGQSSSGLKLVSARTASQ